MAWSREFVDQIRDASDIAGVVGEHLTLKRSGARFKALCPFHKEKTPSFMVNPERQIFKCFGCGMGGDVFRFVMDMEKLTFPEAVEHLAGRAGIAVPTRKWTPQEESVFPALEWAAGVYRKNLASPGGEAARRYLEDRGVSSLVQEAYKIGWAPPGWTGLLDQGGKRYPGELLERAGLVKTGDRGSRYDRFRGRIMIPIHSALGKTIGFGGRSLGDEEPKYLNSPETEAFNKSKVLYGLSEAREALRQQETALVVEGYMDVLALAQEGFTHAVAACGTAFTEDQAALLRRYVPRVILLYDGDQAGRRAAWKTAGICLSVGLDTRVVTFPEGQDPDSWVRAHGKEALQAKLDSAPNVVQFARDVLLDTLERREDLIRAFAWLASRIEDPIRRSVLLQEASETFRFEGSVLRAEADRLSRSKRVPAKKSEGEAVDRQGRSWVTLLITGAGEIEPTLPASVLRESALQKLYARWLELGPDENRMESLLNDDAYRNYTAELLAEEGQPEPYSEVKAIMQERLRKIRGKELRDALRDAETRGDEDQINRLQIELKGLR